MWTFKLPTEIKFGCGSSGTLRETASAYGSHVLVVTDQTLAQISPIEELIDQLDAVAVFIDVEPNPTVANVNALSKKITESLADVVIAIGGGSSIDCAKAASCLALSNDDSIRAYHSEGGKFDPAIGSLPLIAVPTTAGTGSEVTPFAVLDDREINFKGPIANDLFYPKLAVIDPELTVSVPKRVTAATALDALSHAIEGYWSKNHQPTCDLLAQEAAKLIFANLETVLEDPASISAREALAYAALLAGMAFQLPKNAIMHACSFPLSNRFHLPHGAACAFTMEASIMLNAPHMNGRMEHFAAGCGFNSLEEMTASISRLKKLGDLPCNLNDAGISSDDIELLVKESFHPLMNNNPKAVTEEDLRKIYSEMTGNE